MQRRRTKLATALALAVTLGLAACSTGTTPGTAPSGSTGSTPPGSAAGAPASAWWLTGEPKESMWANSFAAFSQAHPDQAITGEAYANDQYKEKIRTAIGAGNAPTLVFSWGAYGAVQEYVDQSKVVDLSGKVDEAQARIMPAINDAGKIDGKTYAVANGDAQPVMLFYNKDLFEQAGVKAPIATWDELLAAIPKFKAIGVAPFALGGGSKWPDLMWLEYLADRVGGPDVFGAVKAGTPGSWSSPEMIQALTYIQDLVKADGFNTGFTSTTTDANADVALVHSGKAAMILQGSWVYGTFKADAPDFVSGGKLGSFPFPTVTGGKGDPANMAGNPSNFWSVAASASPEEQATAIAYLNEVNMDQTMVKALVDGGGVPPVLGAEDMLKASPDADFLVTAYQQMLAAPHFEPSWDQVLPSDDAQELLNNLDQIFQGMITPEQFASNMDATLS